MDVHWIRASCKQLFDVKQEIAIFIVLANFKEVPLRLSESKVSMSLPT